MKKDIIPCIWNNILSIISIINIIIIIGFIMYKNKTENQKIFNILVFIFTITCAVRSIYPRCDSTGFCIHKNSISTPIVGRSMATFAEISFGILIVKIVNIFLNSTNEKINNQNLNNLLNFNNISLILPIIAQVFCWIGITTKNSLYNCIEESLWTLFGFSKFYTLIKLINIIGDNNDFKLRNIKNVSKYGAVFCFLYILFMIIIDVPMYFKRYYNDIKNKKKFLSFKDGFKTLFNCKKNLDFNIWKKEIPWLTFYFTFVVWVTFYILLWYDDFIKII